MSAHVRRLDPATANGIAAGEVIDRPVSVVKELLDNALDAGSSRIDIDLRNGGRSLIQVTDNGSGMSADDAVLAIQRFTTSKIRSLDDVTRLATLGFRGEALPSMAAVADVEIATRPPDASEGVVVRSSAEGETQVQPVGCPRGTRVCVRHLFARIPVRRNALKSVAREVKLMHELVAHYALAYPQVTFHVQHDGRRVLFAPAYADVLQCLPVMFGRDMAAQMLPVQWQSVDLTVYGAVSTPAVTRATRQRQYVWVNGRPIRNGLIGAAVARGYGALLSPGRYPLVALGVTLPPQFLDVNVHPRKTEISFVHERAVFAAVQEAVEMAVQRATMGDMPWEGNVGDTWAGYDEPASRVTEPSHPYGEQRPGLPSGAWQAMGQVGNTFIVASGPDGLVLLDQHAAHESLLYARLVAALEAGEELHEPLLLTLTPQQQQWFKTFHAIFPTLRLVLEDFGRDTVLVREVPSSLVDLITLGSLVEAVHEAQQRLGARATVEEAREQLSAALACRTAMRAGDVLTEAQVSGLVDTVSQHQLPFTCPHGRPTFVTLSLADLERRFLRLFPLDTSA